MPGKTARGLRDRLRRFAAGAALLVVAWQGALSLQLDATELYQRTAKERVRALTAPLEARMRAGFGADYDASLALAAHVRDGWVFVAYPGSARGPELYRRLQHLRTLVCPLALKGLPFDPRHPPPMPNAGAHEYLLDLDSGRDYSSLEGCEELARGEGFRLFLVKGPPR